MLKYNFLTAVINCRGLFCLLYFTKCNVITFTQVQLDKSKIKVLDFFLHIPYNIHRYRKESLYERIFTFTDMPLRVFLLVRT